MTTTNKIASTSKSTTTKRKFRIGICALEKKTCNVNTNNLIDKIQNEHELRDTTSGSTIEVFKFKDSTTLESSVPEWPQCDALLCYHSNGFPIERAIEYVDTTKPFLFNSVVLQRDLLLDRRNVYKHLERVGVPIPFPYICVNHCNESHRSMVRETDDFIEFDGVKIMKPFVEKPLDANDHNIYIYYANNAGCRKLFRKKNNESSKLDVNCNRVRKDGTYLYEPFQDVVGGKDIKVYVCGDYDEDTREIYDMYIHAEQRKSPSVDGVVERSSTGLEMRDRVTLTKEELDICSKIMVGFEQRICGFDILRVKNGDTFKSIVCDVNGYSNVKHFQEFYTECALIMYKAVNRRMN